MFKEVTQCSRVEDLNMLHAMHILKRKHVFPNLVEIM